MKRTILSAVLFLLCLGATQAQNISFTNNTNTWSMIDSTVGCCIPYPIVYSTAHYDGKVDSNGHIYQRLFYDFGSCLVRAENNKIYFLNTADTIERVLYDFTLKLNDVVVQNYQYDTYTSKVMSIDSTQLYGIWYKVWHFEGNDTNTASNKTTYFQYNVIEGIGCTNGVYFPAAPYDCSAYSDQLLCFKNDMGYNTGFSNPVLSYGYGYTGSFDNLSSCDSFHPKTVTVTTSDNNTLGTKQLVGANGNSVVVPDPVDESSKIMLPYAVSGTLIITDELGRTVTRTSFERATSLPVSNIRNAGMYFYQVFDTQNGKMFSGKFSRN